MEKRILGSSELQISPITLRCGSLNQGKTLDAKLQTTLIHHALDAGINAIDTADVYYNGEAERIIGDALESRRDDIILMTKVGMSYQNKKYRIDLSPMYIRSAVEASLKRLKTDHVDILQIHWPDLDFRIIEALETLTQLKDEGKIRHVGISNFNLEQISLSSKNGFISALQVPLNLFKRDCEVQVLPHSHKENIGVLANSPFAHGLLNGESENDAESAYGMGSTISIVQGDAKEINLKRVERLRQFVENRNHTLSHLAINWCMAHTPVHSVVCAAESITQIDEYIASCEWNLSHEELAQVDLLMNFA